jgi:DNA-binding IclR family transcriptional regulator
LGVSTSSAYRYFAVLSRAGLLTPAPGSRYTLGPAIIQLDRQIQRTDPLLHVADPVMQDLAHFAPDGTVVVLCRVFSDTVLCVHHVRGRGDQPFISYERGRPMPLLHSAAGRIILAHLPAPQLRRLHATYPEEIRAAELGENWQAFSASLKTLRRLGYAVSPNAVDVGRAGIAAPILDESRRVLGSITFVVTLSEVDKPRVERLATLAKGAAREIESALRGLV